MKNLMKVLMQFGKYEAILLKTNATSTADWQLIKLVCCDLIWKHIIQIPDSFMHTDLCAWQQNSQRLTQHSSQRFSASPSVHKSHTTHLLLFRVSRNTSSRAKWSVVKPSTPENGMSTSESHWGQSTVTEGWSREWESLTTANDLLFTDAVNGSNWRMQSAQNVCRHGSIFGSRYNRLHTRHTTLALPITASFSSLELKFVGVATWSRRAFSDGFWLECDISCLAMSH